MSRLSLYNKLLTWAINTFAIFIAVNVVPGIHCTKFQTLIFAALILGIFNTLLRPILVILALPFLVVTAGLFYFVINALLLETVSLFVPEFIVTNFFSALAGSLVISFITMIENLLFRRTLIEWHSKEKNSSSEKPNSHQSPCRNDGDDNIIDV